MSITDSKAAEDLFPGARREQHDPEERVFYESCRTGQPANVVRARLEADEPERERETEAAPEVKPATPSPERKVECCKSGTGIDGDSTAHARTMEHVAKLVAEHDEINHPSHYTRGLIEPIDFIESQGWGEGFNCGNVVKYLTRADHKGDSIKDLEKAAWYLKREAERRRKLAE